jgi:predicted O-methyltransferase YrrM
MSPPTPKHSNARPALVDRAHAEAARQGFGHSCRDEVGWLLMLLAAGRRAVAEVGTGTGVGAAWLASAAPGKVVTVERDPVLADVARGVLGDTVDVVTGDWTVLLDRAPFDLVFVDAAAAKQDTRVLDVLAPAGLLVIDDLTPWRHQPAGWSPQHDPVRVRFTSDPLLGVELDVADDHAVIVARRV